MRFATLVCALTAAVLAMPNSALAQLESIGNTTRRAAESEVRRKVDRETRKTVRCAFGDYECVEKARKAGDDVVVDDDQGNVVSDDETSDGPGGGVWRNYDFTPGEKVWFASDFSDERVGRFPANQIEFVKGNMQIVEKDGRRVLEVAERSTFAINLPEALPEDFTLEFALQIGAPNQITTVTFSPVESSYSRYESQYLRIYRQSGIHFQGHDVSTGRVDDITEGFIPMRLQVDGDYAILYAGSERVSNVPNAKFITSDRIEFDVRANANLRAYITDIVVAVGVDDLYDRLVETGSFTTRGIYFAVGSPALQPRSTAALEQIRSALGAHADLEVAIEGHTDSTGDDASNMDLSERRAQSVIDYLADQGIDESRLTAVGKGESEPVADNATTAGRQENRRVVIRRADA